MPQTTKGNIACSSCDLYVPVWITKQGAIFQHRFVRCCGTWGFFRGHSLFCPACLRHRCARIPVRDRITCRRCLALVHHLTTSFALCGATQFRMHQYCTYFQCDVDCHVSLQSSCLSLLPCRILRSVRDHSFPAWCTRPACLRL